MRRIVIADDHPVVLFGIRSLIETSGAGQIVAEAHDADGLMATLAECSADVLVTDYIMPGGRQPDGQMLITMLRRRYPKLPIVVFTLLSDPDLLRRLLRIPRVAVVEKGGPVDALRDAIDAVCAGRNHACPTIWARLAEVAPDTPRLTPKEAEVIRLLVCGLSITEIARRQHRSITTISRQKSDAKRKLGLDSDSELYAYARMHGLAAA